MTKTNETHAPIATGGLAAAVCQVMAAVRYVKQTGRNEFHRYRYASDEDLLASLQPAMSEAGLALLPIHVDTKTLEHSPDRKGKTQWRTDLVVTYRLMHISGEFLDLQAPGCGIDGEDKGAYKAMTGALKYVLRHTFLVPTGDDAERISAAQRAEMQQQAPPQRAQQQAPAQPQAPTKTEQPEQPAETKGFTAEQIKRLEDTTGTWTSKERSYYFAKLKELGLQGHHDHIKGWLYSLRKTKPGLMARDNRLGLLRELRGGPFREAYGAWLLANKNLVLPPVPAAPSALPDGVPGE